MRIDLLLTRWAPMAALTFFATALQAETSEPVYLDPSAPAETRVRDLVARMTLEEKASMMMNTTPGVPRLGIPKYDWWSEALHGVAFSGEATVFPQAIALAAMWDAPLHQEIAHVIGVEGRAKFNAVKGTPSEGTIFHGLTFWSPNINIFRDPRWGRGQETYGEDPFLTSRLGVAFVRGLQGDDPRYLQAAACAKHYAVHSGPESLRHIFDVSPPEADLYETYLPAFEALVREAHVEIVMTAYNSLYQTPCSINPLLYSLLNQWGFNGHVTSDCGSVADLSRTFKRAADDTEAEALTIKAGMSVRCGSEPTQLAIAVKKGLISEAELDRGVSALVRTMLRLGFFDPKDRVPFNKISPAENNTPDHSALALRAAREAMVLLKNDGVLPLKKERYRRVAVIGPSANSRSVLLGNYNGTPSAPVTFLAGLRAALEPEVQVDYAHGCDYSTKPLEARPIAHTWFGGEFFANRDLSGQPVAKRTDRPIVFDQGAVDPKRPGFPSEVPEKNISARWTGGVLTTLAGDYHLVVRGRGGFRLSVGGEVVIDSWIPPKGAEAEYRTVDVVRRLPENAELPFKLEYVQGDGPAKISLEWSTPPAETGEDEAIAKAKAADLIIFAGGISAQLEGEEMQVDYDGFSGGDRTRIEMPVIQQQFLEKLHALGKPMVLISTSGSALALPWADEKMNAILQAWYPGQAGGTAVADVVLGHYNPAGRLPLTFYRATADLPEFTDYRMANRTYRYFQGKPLYAFGHGLSYTRFNYANAQTSRGKDGGLTVTVEITNAGDRDGEEVAQVYATPPAESHPRERQALCGFARVRLAKGEKKQVTIAVPASALRRWSDDKHAYVTPSGEWTVKVGASSADIRATVPVKL